MEHFPEGFCLRNAARSRCASRQVTFAVEPNIPDGYLMLVATPDDIGNASDVVSIEVRDNQGLQRLNPLRPKLGKGGLDGLAVSLSHTTVDEQSAFRSAPQDQDAVSEAGLECPDLHGPPGV